MTATPASTRFSFCTTIAAGLAGNGFTIPITDFGTSGTPPWSVGILSKMIARGVKWNEDFLKHYGINTTMYYIRDDSPEYLSCEGNFTNCFFGRHITEEATGTPTTYILDKNWTLKLAYYTYDDGSSSVEPLELHHLAIPLDEVNFQTIDTLAWTF